MGERHTIATGRDRFDRFPGTAVVAGKPSYTCSAATCACAGVRYHAYKHGYTYPFIHANRHRYTYPFIHANRHGYAHGYTYVNTHAHPHAFTDAQTTLSDLL
jgi:hypothetical protein